MGLTCFVKYLTSLTPPQAKFLLAKDRGPKALLVHAWAGPRSGADTPGRVSPPPKYSTAGPKGDSEARGPQVSPAQVSPPHARGSHLSERLGDLSFSTQPLRLTERRTASA